ncbi:hypothetical protein HZH66_008638 [Vespula vulgaris]|uniref:Kinetochore protein Ndc80 CH domain-containing protein n=2 Tax=Vespula vulgaris TaxID=7454 RepID=A0A834N143_VESVU|nr:hypothetical protein HZH66_008638 [Vespula vulgaris]
MQNNSTGRRSSTNPTKTSFSATDVSHIPRPRMRSSSCDPTNNGRSYLRSTGKSLLHPPTTPVTPSTNARRLNTIGLSTGRRTPSGDRVSNIGAKGARKDTRHLIDKNYQAHMLNKIDSYIHQIQCSSMLNNSGSLKPITLKMFVEVSDLLVKLIDPKQALTLANYIEELPKIAKKLHYPGIITKSLLKTANTAHSWPYVLGWLCWLVEVCEVKDLAYNNFQLNNLPFIGTEQQMKDNQNAFFFMLSMYNAWNDEKLDEEATLVNEYLQEIEKQQGVTEDDLTEAHDSLSREEHNFQEIEQKSKEIDVEVQNLKDILMSLQDDAGKQTSDIKAQEEYIKNLNIETEQLDIQNKHLCERIQIQNKQRTELLSIVKEQPMSKTEKDMILNKCLELQNYMHQFDEHLKDIQKDIYTLDIKIASVNNSLNKIVLAYNKEIFMHFGSDTNIDVEELKMPEKDLLDPYIMDKLNEKANLMNELKDGLTKKLTKLESYIEANTNELELLQEKKRTLQEQNVILHNKLKEKKANINNYKSEESKLREQIQILQNEIQSYQESTPDLQGITSEIEEVKEKLDAVKRRKMFIEQNGKRFFEKLYEIFGEHRNELGRILEKTEQRSIRVVRIMSNKIEEVYNCIDQYNNGYALENIQNPSLIHDNQATFQNEHPHKLVVDNYSALIEVTVKTKGHNIMVSSTPNSGQNTEEGTRAKQNWYQALQEQTRPIVKKSLQSVSLKNQHTNKISSEPKDNKQRLDSQKQLKFRNCNVNKQLNDIPEKQAPTQKKLKEHLKKSLHTGISSGVSSLCSTKWISVLDKGIQCDRIFDSSNDKFSDFNPVRTLRFLMKELKDLIKDEKSCKILTKMEQALFRIPAELKKSTMDLEELTLHSRLNVTTAQLEEISKRVNTECSLREERDSLKRDIEKQLELLEVAQHKQSDLESSILELKEQLNESSKMIESKDKIIAKLKTDISKQMELTRQSHLEMQCLKLERDKLSVLSSYKDSEFNEYRNIIKEFQNQITEHLTSFKEACTREENSNVRGSVIPCGFAHSSLSSAFSDSNILTSWHDISISTIGPSTIKNELKKGAFKKENLSISEYKEADKDTIKVKMGEINESTNNKDSTQLEFISLPAAESILLPSYRDQGCIDQSDTNKDKDDPFASKTKLSNRVQQSVDPDSIITGTKSYVQCSKDNEKISYNKNLSKIRKTSQSDSKKKKHENQEIEDNSRFIESNISADLITSDINEQFQNIFDDVRRKNRISVNVPSPPRHYPYPDWTDSSLPSISVDSESNIVQSNII